MIVADASVVIKWLLPGRGETDEARAMQLWEGVKQGRLQLIQPPHWLAEIVAVLARLSPVTAEEDIRDLHALEIEVGQSARVYEIGCELAIRLNHHLFDTLYHAVALARGGILVTADERYFSKAEEQGSIIRLADFEAS